MSATARPVQLLLAPTLLLLAIAVHGVRIVAFDADPQSGSAFAMFATVDFATTRRVVATAPGDPSVTLELPDATAHRRTRLVRAPSQAEAERLAEDLLTLRWRVDGDTASVDDGGRRLEQVTVSVFGLRIDNRVGTRRELVRHTTVADP